MRTDMDSQKETWVKCKDCPYYAGFAGRLVWCKIASTTDIEIDTETGAGKWCYKDKPARVIKAAGYCLNNHVPADPYYVAGVLCQDNGLGDMIDVLACSSRADWAVRRAKDVFKATPAHARAGRVVVTPASRDVYQAALDCLLAGKTYYHIMPRARSD